MTKEKDKKKDMQYDAVIVGAGISGCTVAQQLADSGFSVLIIEKSEHLGGNCHDEKNKDGILIHTYGPHIFHTKFEEVWDYLRKFTDFSDYKHRVISKHDSKLYPIPINLTTCNKFFGVNLDSEGLKQFLDQKREKIDEVKNSREVVVSKFGEELYSAFVKHYTKKQWDVYPEELDASVLERLPIRYDDNDLYFNDPHQGMPTESYTSMFERMTKNGNIEVIFGHDYKGAIDGFRYKFLVITAPIDEYFEYKFGKLKYRSINFEFETIDQERFQENPVINYPDPDVPYTRITEFKLLTGQKHPKTTICKEIPTWEGIPMYPVPQKETKELYLRYEEEAKKLKDVFFLGRLGRYKYLNMDAACKEALELSKELIRILKKLEEN